MKAKSFVLIVLMIVASAGTAAAQNAPGPFRLTTVPWLTGAPLGMGYDAVSGSITGNVCIVVDPLPERKVEGGNQGEWSFTKIVSKEQLVEKLLASASGEAKFAAWGSGSARMSFSNAIEITQRDTTMLAQNVVSTIEAGTKRGPISDLLKNEELARDPAQFRRLCGTHYVGAITWGGELIMTLQASDRSEAARSSFETNVRATFTAGSGSADFKKAIEKLKTHEELRIVGRKAGGAADTAYTIDSFVQEISTFRKQVLANPKANPLSVTLYPYGKFAIADEKSEKIDLAADKLAVYEEKYQRLSNVLARPSSYDIDPASLPLVQQERERLGGVRSQLRVAIESCIYPSESQAPATEACEALAKFKAPPADAFDSDTPRKFISDCRIGEIPIPDQEFKGRYETLSGDGLMGHSALIQFRVKPVIVDDRILRLSITQIVSEPGSSKKKSEDDIHELTKEVDVWKSSGCVIRYAQPAMSTQAIWFQSAQTQSFNNFVDQATCWRIGGDSGGGSGFRARQYSTFWCRATFLPMRNLQLVNEELLQGDAIRLPKPFKGLSWLDR